MKNIKLYVLGLLALNMMACEYDVSGVLTASENLVFNYSSNAKDQAKRVKKGKEAFKSLAAGQYNAKIEIEDKDIDIKVKDLLAVKFKIPKSIPLPKNGGKMLVPSALTGQPYDLAADVVMDISRSSTTDAYESCTDTVYYEDCSCSADGQITCQERSIGLSAEMPVSYYLEYTTRDIIVDVVQPATNKSVARFKGSRTDSEKIYTYKGMCRADPREVRNIRRTERHDIRNCRPAQPPSGPGETRPERPDRPDRPGRPSRPGRPGDDRGRHSDDGRPRRP